MSRWNLGLAALLALIVSASFIAAGCEDKSGGDNPKPDADAPLSVISLDPSEVNAGQRATIDIRGTGFKDGCSVSIGGVPSPQVTYISSERLVAVLPDGLAAGAADVEVSNPGGEKSSLAASLTMKQGLSVTRVVPPVITRGERDEVRLRGRGFVKDTEVFFGAAKGEVLSVEEDGKILLVGLPELEAGLHDVWAGNPGGIEGYLAGGLHVIAEGSDLPVLPFTESAAEAGLEGLSDVNDNGVAVADFNVDGHDDVLITYYHGVVLLLNDGKGKFSDVAPLSGIEVSTVLYGGFVADFDNDGLPDLFLSGHPSRLFHNLGEARFEEVTERVGLPADILSWSGAWGDYNADGLVDLFVGASRGDDHFFENKGGRFEEINPELFNKMDKAAEAGNQHPTTFAAAFADYDNDGYDDLFVGVRGQPSYLFHNNKGKSLKEVSEKMGIDIEVGSIKGKTLYRLDWGVDWGDYNNDGYFDLFTTSSELANDLYLNKKGKKFENVGKSMRVNFSQSPLCPAFGDFDNDGYLDLAIADNLSGVKLYRNNGDGSFKDVTFDTGLADISGKTPMGMVWFDINGDGALDLLTAEYTGLNKLLINSVYPGRHFLKVRLEGTRSNSMAIGAKVTLQAGSTIMARMVKGGTSYLSQPPQTLHFGLGGIDKVDKLTVHWPGGAITEAEAPAVDTTVFIRQEGERVKAELPAPSEGEGDSAGPEGADGDTAAAPSNVPAESPGEGPGGDGSRGEKE